jgi:hypothetical protein
MLDVDPMVALLSRDLVSEIAPQDVLPLSRSNLLSLGDLRFCLAEAFLVSFD